MAEGPDNDAALRERLDKLSKTLGGRGQVQKEPEDSRKSSQDSSGGDTSLGSAMGAGFKVVTELIAGVIVGGGLGWLLDRWLGTKPILMILLGCLGVVGGFWNIVRAAMLPRGKNSG